MPARRFPHAVAAAKTGTMEAFMASPTSTGHTTVQPTPTHISIQFDGQRIFLGQVDAEESKPSTGGRIDTVTVVAYPSGVFSTLPQSHDLSATPVETLSASSSQLSLSAPATPSNAIDEPSSISSTLPDPSSLSYSQPTATDVETLSEQGSITGSFSSSSFRFHPNPAITLGGSNNTKNSSGPRNSGSNFAHLDPPVYVGIALGSIAAFAILCAMVGWCIRFWYSRRRRKNSAVEVPWAQSQNDDFNGLEAGSNAPADWHANSNLLAGNSMTDLGRQTGVRHWINGRNNEELQRSDGYGGGDVPGFHRGHHFLKPQISSEGVGGGNPGPAVENYQKPPPIRQSLVLGPDRMGGEYEVGTPREEHSAPRYLSLKGDALELPWSGNNSNHAPSRPPPRSAVERLRRASKPVRQTLARSIPSDHSVQSVRPPAPGPIRAKQEGWAGSITSNLVNAFNAVAANVHTFKGNGEAQDVLTPKPSRRGTGRKSTLNDSPSDPPMERSHLEPSSSPSRLSTDSSSMPWTLEEYADGTGVVHLNISPSKRRLDSSSSIHSPSRGSSSPSSHSSIPLVASNIPQAALLRPEISHHFRAQPDDQVSRQSSYSQQSSSASTNDSASFASTEPLSLTKRRKILSKDGEKEKQSPLAASPRRPSLLSRLSSTSSATSWNSQTSLMTKGQVTEVLRARKRTPYSKELDLR